MRCVLNSNITNINSNLITTSQELVNDIPANSDFNNYRTGGTYKVASDVIASTMANIPRSASGRLIVIPQGGISYVAQMYLPTTEVPVLYIRFFYVSAWSSWRTVTLGYDEGWISVITGTVTTSTSGTASLAQTYNTNEYACLSIMTTAAVSGYLLLPYKYGDAANGRWGFKAVQSGTLNPIANTSISYVAVMYKYA